MKAYLNRPDFPMLSQKIDGNGLIYFDNAATTHKSQVVIDAITHFYSNQYATTGRGVYPLAEAATQLCEDVRAQAASFINAEAASEIVFTSGATDSINMVAYAWALETVRVGDEIVLSEFEHHANLLPWHYVAQKTGAKLMLIPVLEDGELDYTNLDTIITSKAKLVAVTHTSNALGTRVNLDLISARAKSVGAKLLIDASQAMIHEQIDVQKLQADFLVFSGHKMFGPTGIGILYVKKSLHQELSPFRRGGGMIFSAEYYSAQWAQMPQLLEAGTLPVAQIVGLGAAISYIDQNVDWQELVTYESALTAHLIDLLENIKGITVLGPVHNLRKNGHQVSFSVRNVHAHDLAAFLGLQGICVRAGHHCAQPLAKKQGYAASVRASFVGYNTLAEVDLFVNALQQATLELS